MNIQFNLYYVITRNESLEYNEQNLNVFHVADLKITYKYDWEYITKKNGKKYMNITRGVLDYANGRTFFKLDNLFGGDKLLGW